MTERASIFHQDTLRKYAPPGHSGTVNVRLVEKDFDGRFEVVHGTIHPGEGAHRHSHEIESQVCYVLEGQMDVELGDEPAVTCGPGSVVTIPPRVEHVITAKGDQPLRLLVIYSPPLPPREDVDLG